MKKTLLILGLFGLAIGSQAQQATKMHPIKIDNANTFKASKFVNSANRNSNTIQTGYIDYSWENSNDLSYVWAFNSAYTSIDTSMNYIGVAINPFNVCYDYSSNIPSFTNTGSPGLVYTIDTIFALITHENNSGLDNMITLDIAKLSGTGALTTTSQVVWTQTDTTNVTLSPGGNWLGTGARYLVQMMPNYTCTPGQKLGIVIKYQAPLTDSLGVIGSSVDDGTGGTMTQSPYATSFMRYPPFIPNISANRGIGYGTPVGSNGWIEVQDWEIWVHVTFDDATGISDNEANKNVTLYQNIPNPANNTTFIKYDLNKSTSVSISFYDITGKKVKEISEGTKAAGKYQTNVNISDLAKGVYFYTLKTAEGASLTKKMIITE